MKLQTNEKKLLILLACVSIFALSFQFLILPGLIARKENSRSNDTLSYAYGLLTNEDGQKRKLILDYEKENAKLDSLLDKEISSYMSDEELDKYFTAMAMNKGLETSSLTIENDEKEKDIFKTVENIYVTIGAKGSYQQLINLMNEIKGNDYLEVIHLNSSFDGSTYNHMVKIQVTMLKG